MTTRNPRCKCGFVIQAGFDLEPPRADEVVDPSHTRHTRGYFVRAGVDDRRVRRWAAPARPGTPAATRPTADSGSPWSGPGPGRRPPSGRPVPTHRCTNRPGTRTGRRPRRPDRPAPPTRRRPRPPHRRTSTSRVTRCCSTPWPGSRRRWGTTSAPWTGRPTRRAWARSRTTWSGRRRSGTSPRRPPGTGTWSPTRPGPATAPGHRWCSSTASGSAPARRTARSSAPGPRSSPPRRMKPTPMRGPRASHRRRRPTTRAAAAEVAAGVVTAALVVDADVPPDPQPASNADAVATSAVAIRLVFICSLLCLAAVGAGPSSPDPARTAIPGDRVLRPPGIGGQRSQIAVTSSQLHPSQLHDSRPAGLQPGDRHPERRAGHVVQAGIVEEVDRLRVAAVLAADAELEPGLVARPSFAAICDQPADAVARRWSRTARR